MCRKQSVTTKDVSIEDFQKLLNYKVIFDRALTDEELEIEKEKIRKMYKEITGIDMHNYIN